MTASFGRATLAEYRTRRVILERYDALAAASTSGKPYQTVLSPPPADPSVADPDTRPAATPARKR